MQLTFMRFKASAAVIFYKGFWVFTRRNYLVRYRRFGTTCMSHLQGLVVIHNLLDYHETLKIRHTNSPETLVSDQIMTPGKTPKTFIQLLFMLLQVVDTVTTVPKL